MTIRVAVLGAGGKMGQAVCAAVDADEQLELAARVDPTLDDAVELADLAELGVSVAIDFTHPEAARANLAFCAEAGIHAVGGTSGFTEADHDELRAQFTRSNCLIVPNFAIGAVLMMRFAELAAPFFDTGEIIEFHHDNKVDAPSGTALATAERMAAASSDWAPDPTTKHVIAGGRGAAGPAGIPIHSVRMRGMVAHQEVVLGAAGQTLTIRHDSNDRASFMPGVVLAATRVPDLPGLTVGLDKVLGL